MIFRDFLLLAVICFVWGLNLVVTRWVIAEAGVTPLNFSALRIAGIAMVLFWVFTMLVETIKQFSSPWFSQTTIMGILRVVTSLCLKAQLLPLNHLQTKYFHLLTLFGHNDTFSVLAVEVMNLS